MKSIRSSLFYPGMIMLGLTSAAFGQRAPHHPDPSTFKRLTIIHTPSSSTASGQVKAAVTPQAGSPTLPVWNYSYTAGAQNGGKTYTGSMVGRSPYFNGYRTTTIPAYVIPVILTFSDGTVYDPTTTDSCVGDSVMDLVKNSPMFQTASFTFTDSNGNNPVNVGTTQYGDAFQRGNFWTGLTARSSSLILPYHTLIGYNTLPAVKVSVPSNDGFTQYQGGCLYGEMNYLWWDNYVTTMILPTLSQINPSVLPIMVFDSVVMYYNNNETECCIEGDHGSYTNSSGQQQTYVVANYDTSGFWSPDIGPLSNEIGKWIDDPFVTNATPPWSWPTGNQIGESCGSLLEVGDPLSRNFPIKMSNGVTYNPEELAYVWWFFDITPSLGAGGWYSDQGYLTTDSGPACSGSTFNGSGN